MDYQTNKYVLNNVMNRFTYVYFLFPITFDFFPINEGSGSDEETLFYLASDLLLSVATVGCVHPCLSAHFSFFTLRKLLTSSTWT